MRNPNRFGQSVIADADVYVRQDGRVLRLEEMAQKVVQKVNPRITETKHLFRFNNHRTLEKGYYPQRATSFRDLPRADQGRHSRIRHRDIEKHLGITG